MGFEIISHRGKVEVCLCDDSNGRLGLRYADKDGLLLSPCGDSASTEVLRDEARTLGRILIDYAERGDLSGAEAIIGGDEKAEDKDEGAGELASRVADLEYRLDGLAAWHKGRTDESLAEDRSFRLRSIECSESIVATNREYVSLGRRNAEALEATAAAIREQNRGIGGAFAKINRHGKRIKAIEKQLACAAPAVKTPQEIADEMTAKFPVGTKVMFALWCGAGTTGGPANVVSVFSPGPKGGYVVNVAGDGGSFEFLTDHVEPIG